MGTKSCIVMIIILEKAVNLCGAVVLRSDPENERPEV